MMQPNTSANSGCVMGFPETLMFARTSAEVGKLSVSAICLSVALRAPA